MMSTNEDETHLTDDARIHAILEAWTQAIQEKDVSHAIAHYEEHVVTFDVIGGLRYEGEPASRKRGEEWFASFKGPIRFERRDTTVVADESIAFASSLEHIQGTSSAVGPINMWIRATRCFRKRRGEWLLVHQHLSVPFDPASGAATLNAQP